MNEIHKKSMLHDIIVRVAASVLAAIFILTIGHVFGIAALGGVAAKKISKR
jgi:hypothetical protein